MKILCKSCNCMCELVAMLWRKVLLPNNISNNWKKVGFFQSPNFIFPSKKSRFDILKVAQESCTHPYSHEINWFGIGSKELQCNSYGYCLFRRCVCVRERRRFVCAKGIFEIKIVFFVMFLVCFVTLFLLSLSAYGRSSSVSPFVFVLFFFGVKMKRKICKVSFLWTLVLDFLVGVGWW